MEGKMAHWKTNNIGANQQTGGSAKSRREVCRSAKPSLMLPDIQNIRRSKSFID